MPEIVRLLLDDLDLQTITRHTGVLFEHHERSHNAFNSYKNRARLASALDNHAACCRLMTSTVLTLLLFAARLVGGLLGTATLVTTRRPLAGLVACCVDRSSFILATFSTCEGLPGSTHHLVGTQGKATGRVGR